VLASMSTRVRCFHRLLIGTAQVLLRDHPEHPMM
jgi:hypothetical protein